MGKKNNSPFKRLDVKHLIPSLDKTQLLVYIILVNNKGGTPI